MIRTRHHNAEVHDEFSQGDGHDGMDDDTDEYDDNNDYTKRQSTYQKHRQNDRD